MILRIVILSMTALVFACSHSGHKAGNVEKGDLAGVPYHFRSKTYFMGSPSAEALTVAKENNVTTLINLQTDEEIKSSKRDLKSEAEARGLKYYHYPIDAKMPIGKESLAEIEATYMLHHKNKEHVIVSCGSGQRAAAWFAYHIKTGHKESQEQALKEAKEVGLSREDVIKNILPALL